MASVSTRAAGVSSRSPAHRDGYVVYDDTFRNLIGPSPTLRRLLTSPNGLPFFHEAGVYLRDGNAVFLSSNRIPSKVGRQRIAITSVPLDAIPPPRGSGLIASLEESDSLAHRRLAKEVKTIHDLPQGLSMPNGATNWTCDGQEAVLWCEQGHDDLDGQGEGSVPAALVAMLPDTSTCDPKTITTLVDNYQGKPFSSLNDVVVHKQSALVFFTDPDYGVGQSFKSAKEQYAPNALYAWDPRSGQVTLIDDRYDKPNGVTFVPDPASPDSGKGFLATTDTGRFFMSPNDTMGDFHIDEQRPACIYTYPIEPLSPNQTPDQSALPVKIGERSLLAHSDSPIPDGLHPDRQGNLWVGSGDGLHVFNPSTRTLIGKVIIPGGKGVANFCWAGKVIVHDDDDGDDEPHQDGQEITRNGKEKVMHRMLLFCEDELWEACVSVDGMD